MSVRYIRYIPQQSGQPPKHWRSNSPWGLWPSEPSLHSVVPSWIGGSEYSVPLDTVDDGVFERMVLEIRRLPINKASAFLRESLGYVEAKP